MKTVLTCMTALLLIGCAGIGIQSKSVQFQDGLIIEEMESKQVSGGWIEQNSTQKVNVILPPSYESAPEKRYPVILFLHGFGDKPHVQPFLKQLNRFYAETAAQEFIFVEPNGTNSLGGSFYWNSPASGNWESYITDEVIPLVDHKYRTIGTKESRGIAGFSMGGTGAVNLALRNPDVFNAVYTFSAGILAAGDMDSLLDSWRRSGMYPRAYGAAISPNKELGKPFAEIPNKTFADNPAENERVIENWYKIFGDMDAKLAAYTAQEYTLSGIRVHVTTGDSYAWIPAGNTDFARLLSKYGIEHVFDIEKGGHTLPSRFLTERVIPFFTEHLEVSPEN